MEGELKWYLCDLKNPNLKEVWVVPTGDVHYGNPLCSLSHFNRHIDFILQNDGVYTVLMGDLCEMALKSSKGEMYHQTASPKEQVAWMIEKLNTIKGKILCATDGNHEYRVSKDVDFSPSQMIANALGVPYRASGVLFKVVFGDNNNRCAGKPYAYFGYATHGYGGARTSGGKAVKLERTSTYVDAAFYMMGHDHLVNVMPANYLVPDPRSHKEGNFTVGRVVSHRKMLVKCNSFLKWGNYSESGGYSPSDLETPIVKLMGTGKPRVRVEA